MPEGAHPLGCERGSRPRAAVALRRELIGFAALVALAAAGCDQGTPHDTRTIGPPIHLVDANVGKSLSLPTNGIIELGFDRLLDPATILRQALPIRGVDGNIAASPSLTYDPVLRVVRIDPGGALTDDQFYTITFNIPSGNDTQNGLRAIDGATFDPAAPADSRTILFRVCETDPKKPKTACPPEAQVFQQPPPDPDMRYCDDIQPIFNNHCAGSLCHAAPGASHQPAAGLVLSVGEGVRYTALNRPAQGSTTGATSGVESPGFHFGVNMPVIDPEHPATSWLLYKVLLAKVPDFDAGLHPARPICGSFSDTAPTTPVGPVTTLKTGVMSDDERARLAEYVLGREMPFPSDPAAPEGAPTDNPPLTLEELERLRIWIQKRAPLETCVPCALSDAGSPSTGGEGGSDAGIADATDDGG